MFKLYLIKDKIKQEVLPINEIYNVYELGDYEIQYETDIFNNSNADYVFIEDYAVDISLFDITPISIKSTKYNKFFQDYFGFATLKINDEVFKLNILIEKFKLSEIEEILMFLWLSENKIFENFFSKSTLKTKISSDGSDYGLTSKFLTFSNYFYETFSKLYNIFKNLPHTVLRKKIETVDYSPEQVSSHSLEWLINNLDSVCFDQKFQGHPDSITIDNKYGLVERLETDKNIQSFSVYENEIILGAFKNIINQLKQLKREISLNINLTENYGNREYADFRDLKKIPYIKLFNDSNSIEERLCALFSKYIAIFKDSKSRIEKPRVTNIFANSPHYLAAYQLIRESFDFKFNFNGELNLLNIRKLSQLYEAYNLHQIILDFKEKLNLESFFKITTNTNRVDGILEYVSFQHEEISIEIFYELKYPNNNISNHIRIDNSYGTYYIPDYIIQFKDKNKIIYSIILDSKYSKYYTLKGKHLPDCMYKYIINTGIRDDRYKKIDDLILIYPGIEEESILSNPDYSPRILLLPSKPKFENSLKNYINQIIEKKLPAFLYKRDMN